MQDFGLGLFVGFLLGAVGFYLAADWLGAWTGLRPHHGRDSRAVDDRPVALRSAAWRTRLADDLRGLLDAPRVSPVRPRDEWVGSADSAGRADRDAQRLAATRARFLRHLETSGDQIDDRRIEPR
jgi:hypothetical protein